MDGFLERLRAGDVLICDGGMGTMLQARGLEPGACPELWCVERSEAVREVHALYRAAGSNMVETNSFGGTHFKLEHSGCAGRVYELNMAAAALAREIAGDTQYVLGSMGPAGVFMEPLGDATEEQVFAAFAEQAAALAAGGADVLIAETMTALDELLVAVRAGVEAGLPVIASMTFDPSLQGGYATMMGVTPGVFAHAAVDAGAAVIGANCGTGPDDMIKIAAELHAAVPDAYIMAMPNAGMPQLENGVTVFRETPEQMASKVPALLKAGVRIIGGCCGTGPEHIRAMAQAVANGQ